jgi:hypothetical protein
MYKAATPREYAQLGLPKKAKLEKIEAPSTKYRMNTFIERLPAT